MLVLQQRACSQEIDAKHTNDSLLAIVYACATFQEQQLFEGDDFYGHLLFLVAEFISPKKYTLSVLLIVGNIIPKNVESVSIQLLSVQLQ